MSDPFEPDLVLYEKVISGDHEAASTFCKRYIQKVFGLCFSILRDQSKAEETTQEAFLSFFKAIRRKKIREPAKVKAYLYQIARNLCIERYRQNGRYQKTFTEFDPEETRLMVKRNSQSSNTPENQVILEQQKLLLREKFAHLNENQREAIYLVRYENYTYKEASDIIGCKINTVKTRVNRGMLKLV